MSWRILVIAPTPYFSDRGCHIRILEEAQALTAAGHQPTIFTYHLGRDEDHVPIYRSLNIPWYKKTSAGPSWHKLYIDVLLLWKIVRTAKRGQFDVIHAHLHEGVWIGFWVKLWLRIPLVADLQGSLVAELGFKTLFRSFERWLERRADHVFVSSPQILTNQSTLLADSINPALFTKQPTVAPTQPVILYTGGLSRAKGIDYLLEAIPIILQAEPTTKFLIIGYGELERCQALVQKLGVDKVVEFIGQVNYTDLPRYLAQGTIAVDPKLSTSTESSGKMLNYMAAGLPVVAFDTMNAQATLGNTGVIARTNTNTGLAEAIIELLRDPAKQRQLGAAAQQRVQAHYTWAVTIQQAIKIYDDVIAAAKK